jgi:hypothetical protein
MPLDDPIAVVLWNRKNSEDPATLMVLSAAARLQRHFPPAIVMVEEAREYTALVGRRVVQRQLVGAAW